MFKASRNCIFLVILSGCALQSYYEHNTEFDSSIFHTNHQTYELVGMRNDVEYTYQVVFGSYVHAVGNKNINYESWGNKRVKENFQDSVPINIGSQAIWVSCFAYKIRGTSVVFEVEVLPNKEYISGCGPIYKDDIQQVKIWIIEKGKNTPIVSEDTFLW